MSARSLRTAWRERAATFAERIETDHIWETNMHPDDLHDRGTDRLAEDIEVSAALIDERDALRAGLETALNEINKANLRRSEQDAEVARLREALEHVHHRATVNTHAPLDTCESIASLARRALRGDA